MPKEGNGPPGLMDNPSAMGAESSSGATSAPQEEQKGGERVVLRAQPDVESSEGAAVLSQVGLESCEPQQRQGEQMTGAAGSGVWAHGQSWTWRGAGFLVQHNPLTVLDI